VPEEPAAPVPVVLPKRETQPRIAPRYKVLIHNDDATPMDFVVEILQRIFERSSQDAEAIMYEAHHAGVALVVVLGFEQAEFKVDRAHSLARTAKYPLTFSIEAA
jgi:ATP-dependent Clp protease adaptor protein ClpS